MSEASARMILNTLDKETQLRIENDYRQAHREAMGLCEKAEEETEINDDISPPR